ncbi:SRPBCC family protein [[Mycobacterium] crassicus]|uniref:SRPBCC family protein n=1 Tax=[Mycobacterium] crassicus TaxID=2872309 RepID=A0ABU5XJ03_9MYCO|nr:SRPBCC family protein [Mycolicibacter sp. MYC098]MEB3022265.1 SRPBCC family protein [Mycolicibacter sp. MYC098]
MTKPSATATVRIEAAPDEIYALITDLSALADCAEEAVEMRWSQGNSARPGAKFVGSNRNGSHSWSTTCTVTAAEPGRIFAFDVRSAVIPVAHWAYEITPVDGGCEVTESTWDRRPRWIRGVTRFVTGVADRTAANGEHIRLTLDRLKQRAERNAG